MKKFVVKTVIFLLILLLYFGVNAVINYSIYSLRPVPLVHKSVLIAGDSHTQQSLNPNLFSSAHNISLAADPYVVIYWKLQKIVESYRPDTLIIGFAPHNIAAFNDAKFIMNREGNWASELYRRTYPIEHFHEIDSIVPIDYLAYYKILWKQICFYPKISHENYIGYYYSSPITWVPSEWKKTIDNHYFSNGKEQGLSDISVSYLDSIVNLCQTKHITLVLVSNPVHKNYFDHIPPEIWKTYDSLKTQYKNKAIIIDRTQEYYPDSLHLDTDHLNERGSTRFTKEVIEDLKSKKVQRAN